MLVDSASIVILLALVLDYCLGETQRYHPLVGFGRIASYLEQTLNRGIGHSFIYKFKGILAVLILILPLVALIILAEQQLQHSTTLSTLFSVFILYLVIAPKSLEQHARAVQVALQNHDLPAARAKVGYMVSRETQNLDQTAVNKAAIESLLENGNDAVFGPLIWYMIAGIPGAVVYRIVNTLDAMWGYRSTRYLNFGWAAARFDDLLNWLPARCCSLCYSLAGKPLQGLHCWRTQAKAMESPNAGPVMSSGAGALNLSLGGAACYEGRLESRSTFGTGPEPGVEDIGRAIILLRRALLIFAALILLLDLLAPGRYPWL